jgi:hypothetical protein
VRLQHRHPGNARDEVGDAERQASERRTRRWDQAHQRQQDETGTEQHAAASA